VRVVEQVNGNRTETVRRKKASLATEELLRENEWFARALAAKLQMPKNTLLEWVRRGWVHVAWRLPGYRGRKICWADTAEIARLIRLRGAKRRACDPTFPPELTTPKIDLPLGDP